MPSASSIALSQGKFMLKNYGHVHFKLKVSQSSHLISELVSHVYFFTQVSVLPEDPAFSTRGRPFFNRELN